MIRPLPVIICLLAVLVMPTLAESAGDLMDRVTGSARQLDITRLRESATCPAPLIGKACIEANPLFYQTCCGNFHEECCFRPQDWVSVLVGILVLLFIISIVANILKCLCA